MQVSRKLIKDVGAANGIAPLDATNKVPAIHLPSGTVAAFNTDTVWNGSDITKTVTVSGVSDARTSTWQLLNNADDFARIFCSLKAISSTQVQIDVNPALPSGNYRLVGVG